MAIQAKVTAGWTYTTGDTVTAANLNALGIPAVEIEDGETMAFGDGSASSPAVTFVNDTKSGFHLLAPGEIGIAINESDVVTFDKYGAAFLGGTFAEPGISFIGDRDTGLTTNGKADELYVTVGGNEAAAFTAGEVKFSAPTVSDSGFFSEGSRLLAGLVERSIYRFATDCVGAPEDNMCYVATTSDGACTYAPSTANWYGAWTVNAKTGTTAEVTVGPGGGSGFEVATLTPAVVERAVIKFELTVNPALSTGSERYVVTAGISPGNATAGIYFRYNDSIAAQWQCVVVQGSTETAQTTAHTVAVNQRLWMEIRYFDSSAEFYINNVLVGTMAVGSGAFGTSVGVRVQKLIGTAETRGIILGAIVSEFTPQGSYVR